MQSTSDGDWPPVRDPRKGRMLLLVGVSWLKSRTLLVMLFSLALSCEQVHGSKG